DPEPWIVELVGFALLDLFEIGLERGLLRPPIDAELLHQGFGRACMPMGLHDLVGIGATDQRGELAIGQYGQLEMLAFGLTYPLVLVERGDASSVMADHDVGPGLLHCDPDLAVDGE